MSKIHLAKIGYEKNNVTGQTRKDWIGETDGTTFRATWGAIGKSSQSKEWHYGSEGECEKDFQKTVASKLKGGYKEFAYSLTEEDFEKLQGIIKKEFDRHEDDINKWRSTANITKYSDLRIEIEDLNINRSNRILMLAISNLNQQDKKVSFSHNLILHGSNFGDEYRIYLEKK